MHLVYEVRWGLTGSGNLWYEEVAKDARRLGLAAKVEDDHVHVQGIMPFIGGDDGDGQ